MKDTKELKKQPKTKNIKKIIFFISFIILVGLVWKINNFIKTTEFFQIQNFKVLGSTVITKEKIIEAVNLKPGINIFKIKVSLIKKILSNFSHIEEVIVKKELPDTLVIQIIEREPELFLNIENETILAIDEDKTIFPIFNKKVSKPIITIKKSNDIKIENSQIDFVFSFFKIIKNIKPDLIDNVSEINLTEIEEPQMYFIGGLKIKLDFANQDTLYNFFANYKEILGIFSELEYVDLRFEDIIVKPKNFLETKIS